jgi:CMP-N-acetylneuraminic acid synthetase
MSQINEAYFLIPARKGSKGLPFKNRKLLYYTLSTLPTELYNRVYVSTDDEHIKEESLRLGVNVIDRPQDISDDEASVKDVMLHFINTVGLSDEADVVLLYLTYPERTWEDIVHIYDVFKKKNGLSLICADEATEHPYLCLYDKGDMKGELVVDHNMYRRQDYPKCFKHSLYVGCYKVKEIPVINDLLINKKTLYFKLENKKVDVDTDDDFKNIKI